MFKSIAKIWIFLLISIVSFCEESKQFVIEDAQTYQLLKHFFRKGIDREQYGYILEGTKPVSCRYYRSLSLFPSSKSFEFAEERFIESLLVEKLIPILEKINQHSSRFTFKSAKKKQNGHVQHEFLFINNGLLGKTIRENLHLFRFALDPSYEASELIDLIIHSKRQISDILNLNDTLFGIVVGYLPQNSLLGGRKFSVHKQSISQDQPPFERQSRLIKSKNPLSSLWMNDSYGLYYIAHAGGDSDFFQNQCSRLQPSCRFQTIEEELNHLRLKKRDLPSCFWEKPTFIFGPYQTEDTNNPSFFALLKKTQQETINLSEKENLVEVFLEKTLGITPKIICSLPPTPQSLTSLLQIGQQEWAIILKEVLSSFQRPRDRVAFLKAFQTPSEEHRVPPKLMGASPQMKKGISLAIANLKQSNTYFESIPKEFKVIEPKHLYYQILKSGEGKQIKGCDKVRLHYTLEDLKGNILSAHYNAWFKLSEVFQGFRHGVQGMHEGEKRKILIHPSLGYGSFTTLPPCSTLILKIELLQVVKTDESFYPPLEPIDFSLIEKASTYEKIKSSIDQLPFFKGAFYAEMFEKFGSADKNQVISELKKAI